MLCMNVFSTGAFELEEAVHFSVAALRTAFSFSILQVFIKVMTVWFFVQGGGGGESHQGETEMVKDQGMD